ncbi:MAG: hypothetical protein ACREQ4_09475 [Candidatus Binataceae bacterium]
MWAWYFAALQWRHKKNLKELEKDDLEKGLTEALDTLMDRWLICSQWAGVWASGSAQAFAGYGARLATCAHTLGDKSEVTVVVDALKRQLESEIRDIEQPAVNGLISMNADDRQQVRVYYTALWLWNRLDKKRWQMAKIALREKSHPQNSLEVDHIVAWDLWQSKLKAPQFAQQTDDENLEKDALQELDPVVNELGNCMLLEKNFNISKSNRPLLSFLEGVYEFKTGTIAIKEWAAALYLKMRQVDSSETPAMDLRDLFNERTQKIRNDLEQFIRGSALRIDLDAA